MDVYILDELYRRTGTVIDRFESMIWTERFSSYGDFELIVHSTFDTRTRLVPGVRLAINESYRVMTIETVEDTTDADGRQLLKVKGPSLEEILEDRVAMGVLGDLTTNPKWIITDAPADIARTIFHEICIDGTLDLGDIIPSVTEGSSIFPEDTIGEPTDEVTYEIEPQTVYTAIKNIADLYDFGFRLVRNLDTSQLYFDVYMGCDRTTQQSTLPAVVFSPELDNLQNTTQLTTTALYKNVAYVVSPVGAEVVYPLDIDPEIEGFERHVLLVVANDITDVDPGDATDKMIQRGLEALSRQRKFSAFDGEINQNSQYKYGTHYNLGDLVELRNTDGHTNVMQVTEQIFVSDKEGERTYPTLQINEFITPGSWLAWDYNQVWEDLGEFEYWEDQ
jgi:hypothetical protein